MDFDIWMERGVSVSSTICYADRMFAVHPMESLLIQTLWFSNRVEKFKRKRTLTVICMLTSMHSYHALLSPSFVSACTYRHKPTHTYSKLMNGCTREKKKKKAPGRTFFSAENHTGSYCHLGSRLSFRAVDFHHTERRENIVAYGCACVQHRAVACLRNNKELLPEEERILWGLGYSLEMYLCSS